MPQSIPQFSGRFSATSQPNGASVSTLSNHQRQTHSKNPFKSSDLEKSAQSLELCTPEIDQNVSNPGEKGFLLPDSIHDDSNPEELSLQQPSEAQDRLDTDDRVFFDETGKVKWPAIGLYVFMPGAIGGAGRWIRKEVKLQNQPQPPVPSNMWLSTDFYYSITLGLIAAIIGNFVLARLILKIDKNKLTYLGLSLIFGMFYSTVFAMGGQAVLSSEGKIDQNQAVAIASDKPEVQQQAIDSNQSIATSSDDPGVKEEAIEASEAIATSSDDPGVKEEAIQASEAIATSSDDSGVKEEAIAASEAIATSENANVEVKKEAIQASQEIATSSDDSAVQEQAIESSREIATSENANAEVQQEAIEASQEIALQSEDPNIQEQAIDTNVAIFEIAQDPATQIAAIQSISDLALNSPAPTVEVSVRQNALDALKQIEGETLDPAVIDELNKVKQTIEGVN